MCKTVQRKSELRAPTKATLRKYGLEPEDWELLAHRQGRVCAVCRKLPKSGRLAIDHVHTPGWRKLEPDQRRLFVRALLCWHCNRNLLNRWMTVEKWERVGCVLKADLPFHDAGGIS